MEKVDKVGEVGRSGTHDTPKIKRKEKKLKTANEKTERQQDACTSEGQALGCSSQRTAQEAKIGPAEPAR